MSRRVRVRDTCCARCFIGLSFSTPVLASVAACAIAIARFGFVLARYARCASSCAGVATVARVASAVGLSSAASRRVRVCGTCGARRIIGLSCSIPVRARNAVRATTIESFRFVLTCCARCAIPPACVATISRVASEDNLRMGAQQGKDHNSER